MADTVEQKAKQASTASAAGKDGKKGTNGKGGNKKRGAETLDPSERAAAVTEAVGDGDGISAGLPLAVVTKFQKAAAKNNEVLDDDENRAEQKRSRKQTELPNVGHKAAKDSSAKPY